MFLQSNTHYAYWKEDQCSQDRKKKSVCIGYFKYMNINQKNKTINSYYLWSFHSSRQFSRTNVTKMNENYILKQVLWECLHEKKLRWNKDCISKLYDMLLQQSYRLEGWERSCNTENDTVKKEFDSDLKRKQHRYWNLRHKFNLFSL